MSCMEITFSENVEQSIPSFPLPFAITDLIYSSAVKAERLSSGKWVKTVYDLSISRKGIGQDFLPGDTIGILPQNDELVVTKVINRLNIEDVADKFYTLSVQKNTKKKIPSHIPPKGTLRNLFIKLVDLNSTPKKLFLKSLIQYTKDEQEVERLKHLCSPEGSAAYGEFLNSEGRSLIGLLASFPSCQPPVELILEHSTSLKPRPYSISSSPLDEDLHITFFVLEHSDQTKGVCTGWLERLIEDNNLIDKEVEHPVAIPLYFRKTNAFRLPVTEGLPIIMIATGTGIAPFRGFLRHRTLQMREENNHSFGPMWLFYGCRYASLDFLYKSEITQYLRDKVLHRLHVAFSRECRDRVYVQNKLEEYGAELSELILEGNAVIYICGDPKLVVTGVKETLKKIFVRFGHLTTEKAQSTLKELEDTHRCITDVWC